MPDADDWRIDHTGIGVSSIGRSAKFYDAALGALGLRALTRITRTLYLPRRARLTYDGQRRHERRTGSASRRGARVIYVSSYDGSSVALAGALRRDGKRQMANGKWQSLTTFLVRRIRLG
jgi:catechol 2,3-dioxygenase-like lactoylglutathione lyase family enzyme